jgi:pyrroloquinoline quinone biosynthesis protein B
VDGRLPVPTMQAIVLGSAAGGGVPQWNCRCPICSLAWAGDPRIQARTQSSLAVSADGAEWVVVNASPDIRQQISATPALQPHGLRSSPIRAVVLTNGDVDHVAGLLSLRESGAFDLFATSDILTSLADNRVFDVLAPASVRRIAVQPDTPFEPLPGLRVNLFAVPGKVPLWLETGTPDIGTETESTVGALFTTGPQRLAYIPGCARITDALRERVAGVDALLFDGTVLDDDDMIKAGVGSKTGWRMGHVSMRGQSGSLQGLVDLGIGQRIYVHINNTNPALIEGSAERREVEAAGWIVAHDGLSFTL